MENETQTTPSTPELSPEQEMAQAQAALAAAKQKVADAQKLRITQAEIALQEWKQKEEEKILLRKLEADAIYKKWAAKKRREEEERLAEQQRLQTEQITLEARLNKEQEELRKSQEHEKELRRLSDEAFRLEQQARQEEADALRVSAPIVAEEVITIHSPSHPLSKILGVKQVEPTEPTPVPHVEPTFAPDLRKESTEEQQYVASVWSSRLSTRPNTSIVVNLLRRFSPAECIEAISTVAAYQRFGRFTERDTQARAVECVCWNNGTLDDLIRAIDAEKEARRAEREAHNGRQ